MSVWPLRRLDDVVIFLNNRRVPLKAADRAKRQGKYPYYGASGVVDYLDDHLFDGKYLLISEDGENLRSRKTPIAFRVEGRFWVNNHAHIVDEREPGVLDFLEYAFSAFDLNPYITGAAQPKLNKRTLQEIKLPIPPECERLAINHILNALTDKIELNRRMNRTLEAMARALFRSWFVDFDPVRARAEGRAPAHMDPATAALFPARFGEDGLPEGWVSKPIGEAADILGGSTPSTTNPAFWDGGFLWATPRDLSKLQTPVLMDTERKITDAGVQQISSRQLPAGTLLLSSRAPIGYLAIARRPVSVNQGFIAIRESAEVSGVHALFWCGENMEAIVANANGSTFQEISKRNFRPLAMVIASPGVRDAFTEQAGTWVNLIAANEEQSRTLAALRDALLPKLMSGELRVRDAERVLAEAV